MSKPHLENAAADITHQHALLQLKVPGEAHGTLVPHIAHAGALCLKKPVIGEGDRR